MRWMGLAGLGLIIALVSAGAGRAGDTGRAGGEWFPWWPKSDEKSPDKTAAKPEAKLPAGKSVGEDKKDIGPDGSSGCKHEPYPQ